mgnify:CR=1 FL=1
MNFNYTFVKQDYDLPSMKKILVALILFSILIGCNSNTKNTTTLSHLIPENTTTVLKITDLESFKNDLKNNDFFNKTYNFSLSIIQVAFFIFNFSIPVFQL